jgi:hypothetical protein
MDAFADKVSSAAEGLARDPSPAVRAIGLHLLRCVACNLSTRPGRCEECVASERFETAAASGIQA